MTIPGLPSLFFLAYLLLVLPWAAWRGARRFAAAREEGTLPSRQAIWGQTLFTMALLWVLTWFTAGTFDYPIFAVPEPGWRVFGLAVAALLACLGLRLLVRRLIPAEQRRGMTVFYLAPRTPREHLLSIATVLAAAVAEEAAYRGVLMTILWYSLCNPWLAALISATAFALAHAAQGKKSMLVIFGFALLMHGLVALTGSLVPAMVVHAVYDLIAGYFIGKEARRFDAEAAA